MAENLGGISEDVSALIRAINAALPQSNTKKTVDIKVNGAKELKEAAESVKTFGAAVKTLDESGVDRVTKSVGSIMGLLSGKLKNAPVSSITTSLIEVFTKPDASAKELLDTVLRVQSELENVQRLSKKIDVSLLTSSQLSSLLSRQSKIDELRYEFSSDKESKKSKLRREAYQKYEDIDVYQMARNRKNVGTAKEIATRIGINPDDVTSADAEQLQTYIRTLDLLRQLIKARKEYGEIHTSTDANDYLKQEQQISKVFQDLLKQEAAIRSKFKVKEDPLSAAFGLDEQTVKQNAQQAAEAYVNWFMRTLQTQLNTALADLDTRVAQLQGNIEERTERSAQRVEKNTKFARGRGNGGTGGGSGSGTGGTGEGVGEGTGGTGGIGTTTAAGMEKTAEATDVAIEKIQQYIVKEEEAVQKIKKLFKEIDDLYNKQVDAASDKEREEIDVQIRNKLLEASKYRANLQRLGWPADKDQINEKLKQNMPEDLSDFVDDIDDAMRGSSTIVKENRQLVQAIRDFKQESSTAFSAQPGGINGAVEGIKEYIVEIEQCINKINELADAKLDFEIGSTEYNDYLKEQVLYFARLQKLGVSQDRIRAEIGDADYEELSAMVTKIQSGDFGDDIKIKYNAILSYVDSNPVTVKVETEEAKKKVDEIKKTLNELSEQSKTVEFGAVFDSRTGRSSKTYSGKDKQIDLAEAYADAKKSGIQADTYFHTHPDVAKYAAFSLQDIQESIKAVKDGIRQSVLMVGDEVATMDVGSLANLGQDFLDKFYSAISAHVTDGLNQLRENIAQNLSYGDVIDNLPLITKQLQDELKEALSSYNLTSQDIDIIQPVINAGIDQVSQKLLELVKSGEKLQGRTLINDSIQNIIDNILNSVKSSIVSSGINIDPNVLGNIMSDTFGSLDSVFDQEKFKKMFAKENLPLDKMALIQQKAISDALLQLGKEPEDFYKILTKDQFLGQVYDGENPKSKLHIDVSEAVNEINALKEVVASLKEQIQQLSETKVVVDVDALQARLERAQEEIDELNHALAGTVSESSNTFLSEQLSEAEQRVRELSEEVESLKQQLADAQAKNESPISSDTSALPEQERAAGEAAAAVTENMKNQSAAAREAEENYNRLNNAVQQYIENQNKVNTGNFRIVHTDNPKDRGRISDMVNYTDIRNGRTTKASIKKLLNEYINNKKELDTGYLHGLTDEESFKLSDDDLRFRASNADRILDKLSAYVYSYQNMEEAAKLFGKANSEVFDEVQRRIENAKIANEAFEASFTKSDNVRYALSKYGINEMTARQLGQLESAMETGGFEAFAAKVKELFGVEIPSSIEEAREAINNLNSESQSLSPSQDGETSSQKREQENETEVQSVEQLIAEYERLGSVLNSIESKYNAGQIPLGEARDTWNEVNENRKAIAEKLTQSGMYYSPDQEKWVQDIINLEDKYKELSALIESGDKKAISEMFKIDESSLGDLEVLKNNLKMVIDVLNATDGMSASSTKLSWWNGWLGGGSDLLNADQLTGAFKTLGISDEIIERIAQAHRDAAAAAKEHATEEEAAADATKNVVDAAGAQKVPGREQPSINPENTGETTDMSALGDAVNTVTKAVDGKTTAFSREAQIVQESVQIELASLQQLVKQLEAIRDLSQNLPKIQLTGKDGTKANPIISPELIQSIEQLKAVVGDFDPAKLTALFASIKNLKINENVSTRMTELATGFTDLRNALDGWEGNAARTLEMITQLVQKANALKDVIKTANEQNVKQPRADAQKAQKKEPEKPVEKSQDEIRADQLKAYNAALKEYDQLERERVRNSQQVNDLGAETLNKRIQLIKQMDDIQKQWNDSAAQGVAKTKEMLDAEQQRAIIEERIKVSESNKWNDYVKKNIGFSNLQNRVSKLKEEKDLRPDIFGERYKEIEDKAKELSKMFPLKPFDEKAAEDARNVAEELGKMIAETRNAPEYKQAKDTFISGLNRRIETWAINNQRAIKADPSGFEKIRNSLKEIDTLADGQNVSKMFDEFVAGANRAGNAGETFTQGLMKRFKSMGQYLLSFASFYRVIGVIKQAFNTVKQLDDALTEMRKVSDESLSSLKKYQSLSFDMADEVGTTSEQIQKSTADWLRLGESFEEAQKSAKESTVLLNVSEFENIDSATQALVSASQAYKNLDKIDIIDKLNNIGNNFSISTDQLATGLQNAAAVLMTQGNDIDQSLALLTAGNAITQDISKTSAGIRTISLRISGTEEAKDEIQEIGEDVDDFVVRTKSKTDQIIRDYTAVASNGFKGVSVLDANGNLRSTYDILLDIAKVYEEIQAEDKKNGTNRAQALVETLAGKNRSNIAASILQNPEMLEEVYKSSKKSAGSAQQELDKYLDSITGKVAKLQNAIQELTFNALDSEPLKAIVDLLTSAVNLVNGLIKNFGAVNLALGGLIGGLASKYGKGFLTFNKGTGIDIGSGIIKSIMQSSQQARDILADELESNSYVPEMLISDMDASVLDSYSGKLQQVFENVRKVKGESANMGDVMNAIKHPILGVGGALEKVGTLAAKFVTTVGNMAIYTLISVAASAVINAVIKAITWENELIKASEEAQNAITDMFDSFQKQTDSIKDIEVSLGFETNGDQSIDKTVSNIADKYSALHEGVNGVTNENINLTNDEYQQYLDTCNQIADQYPSLVKGWDSQGNAILNLGNSAKDARDAIMGMYEAQQLSANVQIGENLDTLYQGLSIKSGKIDKENEELAEQNEQLQKQILWDSVNSTLDMSGHKITASISEGNNQIIQEIIKNVIGRSDAYDELVKNGSQYQLDNTIVYDLDQIQGMTDEKIAQIEESLSRLQASPGEMSIVASNTEQALTNELKKADLWASMRGAISQYLQTSKSFKDINDDVQTAILGNLSDLDLSKLENGSYENAVEYIYGEILTPMSKLNKKAQQELAEAFTMDTSKIDQQTYYSEIKKIFTEKFGAENADKWMQILGFDAIFDDLVYGTSAIFDEFGDSLIDSEIQAIKNLPVDQIRKAIKLIGEKSYKNLGFDQLWKDIIKEDKPIFDDLFSDLLKDEGYSDKAEKYKTSTSAITEALETLRTEGKLTAEQMISLQESFPDFFKSSEDFSFDNLSGVGAKELSKWVGTIKEAMKTMKPDAQEAAQTYIDNLIDSMRFDVGEEAMRNAVYDSLITSHNYNQSIEQGIQANNVIDSLQKKYGNNLDRDIVYKLALKDELSGPLKEIYKKYDALYESSTFNRVSDDLKSLGRDFTNLQDEGQEMQDVISFRETKGIKTTVKNYNRLLKNNKDQIKNLKTQNDLLKKQQMFVGRQSDKWYEIQDQIDQNVSSIRGLISSQYEYGQNMSMAAITNTQGLLSQLRNAASTGHMDSSSLQELISMARGNADDILTTTTTGTYADPQAIRELYEEYSDLGLSIVNTQMAAEQLDFSNNEKEMLRLGRRLDPTIENINDLHRAMAQNPDNPDYAKIFDLDEENQGILQTITNLQSLEEEILANASALGQYQAALNSANWSDPMQTIRSGMEDADKLYEQGWWGKDDFTSYANLIATNDQLQDKTGWAAIEAYETNRDAVKRYLTEDASGVHNWVDDMVTKSKELGEEWATLDEQGNYTFNVQDMEKFATAMGRSTEFAEYMLMAMKDANYDIDILRIDDEFSRTFNNISGTEANAAQQVKNLVTEMQNVALAGGDISQGAEAAGLALMRMREAGVSDDVINSLVEELNLLGQFNGFHIDPKTLEVTTTVDTNEIDEVDESISEPRRLMIQYGVEEDSVKEAHNTIMSHWKGNEQNIRYATKALQDYTAEQLLAIDHNDGAWSEGEKEIESFAETLGLPLDQVNALIIALEQMGMLKPEVNAEVNTKEAESGVETLREKLAKPFKAIVEVATENEPIQNIKDKIKEKFQTGLENVKLELQQKEAEKQFAPLIDATSEIPDAVSDASSDITGAISNGASDIVSAINGGPGDGSGGTNGTTTYSSTTTGQPQHTGASSNASRTANSGQKSSNNSSKSNGDTSIGTPIQSKQIDYSVTPTQQIVGVSYIPNVQQVENTNEQIEENPVKQEVELVNKGDNSNQEYNIDSSGAMSGLQKIQEMQKEMFGNTPTLVPKFEFTADGSQAQNEAEDTFNVINRIPKSHNTNITATDNASDKASQIRSTISSIRDKVVNIVAKVSGETGVSNLASKIAGLASKTVSVIANFAGNAWKTLTENNPALGTAHSSGTTLGHGYANGTAQDWTVGKDEEALTNEVGQESIVRNGKWSLLPGGPHVEKLKKNDIVY